MSPPDPQRPTWLTTLATWVGLAAAVTLGWLALSRELPEPPAVPDATGGGLAEAPVLEPCLVAGEGYWLGRLVATRTVDIDWRGASLECAGNARPGDRGLRLFFAGRPDGGAERLLLIIGISAGVDELAGREHGASVTLVDEATSSFFRSRDGSCFTRVHAVTSATDGDYRVEGDLYCASALAAVGGEGSVSLGDTAYAGRLTPNDPGPS
jgi:hypothetical protein